MGVAARGAHDADEPGAQITDVAPAPQPGWGERNRRRFEITIRDPPQAPVRYDGRRVVEARERREPREPVWNVAMPQEREAVGAGTGELRALQRPRERRPSPTAGERETRAAQRGPGVGRGEIGRAHV